MNAVSRPDIDLLAEALGAAEREARDLVAGLTEAEGALSAAPGSWSVAECLDHLATANRVYLRAMQDPAERAQSGGRRRRGLARPGLIGRWFVRALEPPVKRQFRMKAPRQIKPRTGPSLADAAARCFESRALVRAFLRQYADLDLAAVRFPNPFIPGVRFSLATGLHVIAAHERRHLWQARTVAARVVAADRRSG